MPVVRAVEQEVDRKLRMVAWVMIVIIGMGSLYPLINERIHPDQLITASHYWLKFSIFITWLFTIVFHIVAIFDEDFLEGGALKVPECGLLSV